ncbi:MAG TPA: GNAT family N-acyltransferase [Candidatus Binatia bacterium]|nr:GNAT family N-acyltransferase [Candidatus Binatia bacterium]
MQGPLVACLARTEADVREAQRLRYRVFVEEMGARLPEPREEIDRDAFDAYCEHLLVRDGATGAVVGTYRILSAEQARRVGRLYAESEFDVSRLRDLPGLVEIGRACVDPAYRSGAVLARLWEGLATHLRARRYEHVIGCGSIPLAEEPAAAAGVCRGLLRTHLGPERWRVFPRRPFPLRAFRAEPERPPPPLIRGYLRMGAVVCGPPAWDSSFGTADILLLLPMAQLDARWARRLLRAA